MFFESVKSPGIAHVSYMVADGGEAAVIDPRRDCDVYIEMAQLEGVRITHIFETHRNEDYVIGSCDLAERTGATIHHGAELPFEYGETVDEGDTFALGDIRLRVLKTPGHTDESISIVLTDTATGDGPVGVFTGDCLFVGDVGRTDFFPDRAREVAGLLYDSLFDTLMPLGDHVIVWPAHGAGSVCGAGMADRDVTTLGYERAFNPSLQVDDREAFIDLKVNENHEQPPYFRKMEELNLKGAPPMPRLPMYKALSTEQLAAAVDDGAQLVDARSPEDFSGAHIPGALAIPLHMIPAYAGWFLTYDKPIVLVLEHAQQAEQAARHFARLGFDQVEGFLAGGLLAWETSGRGLDFVGLVHTADLNRKVCHDGATLLDVRKDGEWEAGHLAGATHVFLGELPDRLDEVPKDKPVITFCGSGQRAIIAASILKRNGYEQVADNLGSMEACQAVGCSTECGKE